MPNEIERKFLIDVTQVKDLLKKPSALTQAYITLSEFEEKRVRMIMDSDSNSPRYVKTIKRTIGTSGLVREELEDDIEKLEYDNLFAQRDPSMKVINKLRYELKIENYRLEIDIYLTDLKGLVTGEIEFPSGEEAKAFDYKKYKFMLKDITTDKRYKNAQMAKNGIPVDEVPKRRNSGMEKE